MKSLEEDFLVNNSSNLPESDLPFYKRKLFFIIIGLILILIVVIIIIIVSSNSSNSPKTYKLTPSPESTLPLLNPDQGISSYFQADINEDYCIFDYPKVSDYVLDARIDIAAFSKENNGKADIPLNEKGLQCIEEMMQNMRNTEKNVAIRFAYDPGIVGEKNKECGMDMIKTHIKQLGEILNKYPDVITAIYASLVGPWGEMHSSEIVTWDNVTIILNEWSKYITHEDIPILLRNPRFIFHFFGKYEAEQMENVTIEKGDKGYNFGVWNDCIYGDDTDVGTWVNRTSEINWLSTINYHLPYGGEYCHISETITYKMENCIPELFKNKMSYVRDHCDFVQDKLKNQIYNSSIAGHKIFEGKSAFEFIKAHLGHRFVMKEISIVLNDKNFDLKIEIVNNGFGNLNKHKKIGLVYSYDKKDIIKEENDLGVFYENQSEINIKGNLINEPTDKYYVYLRLYYDIRDGKATYPIRFANIDIFNEELRGNFLFEVNKDNSKITI